MRNKITSLFALLVAVVTLSFVVVVPVNAAPQESAPYLIQFSPNATAAEARSTVAAAGGNVKTSWSHVGVGVAADLTPAVATALARNPRIQAIEPDAVVTVSQTATTRTTQSWGLDRIDQRYLPLSGTLTSAYDGTGVRTYIVDTGVNPSHAEFTGRVAAGYSAINDGYGSNDCHWHGTHVAGTVAGTTYGVAPKATIVPVRVLGCDGSGTWSQVISGLDWVAANHPAGTAGVVNMSLGGSASTIIDDAVKRVIAKDITTVVAAGNESADACTKSPARTPEAITVAATNARDARTSWSNYGSCVDVFAPGENITSAYVTGGAYSASGTSMASPHVAGVAALIATQQGSGATVASITSAITSNATTGMVTSPGSATPNRLLFIPNGTTQQALTLSAPTNVKAVGGKSKATVSWTSPPNSETITITLTGGGRSYTLNIAATASSYTFTGIAKATYSVSVVAKKGTVVSPAATTSVVVS